MTDDKKTDEANKAKAATLKEQSEENAEFSLGSDTEIKEVKEDLYNANDGIFGRNGGPYLDEEEAKVEERTRALREDRKPILDKVQPYPGIVLRTKKAQVDNYNPTILAGDDRRDLSEFEAPVLAEGVFNHPVASDETK